MSATALLLTILANTAPCLAQSSEAAPTLNNPEQHGSRAEVAAANVLPDGIAAQWDGGEVDFQRFERFLGRNFRGKPLGQQALHHLLQIQLVENEAKTEGINVNQQAVDELVAEARAQASEVGMDLSTVLKQRRMSEDEFAGLLRGSLLHEALVRKSLGLADEIKPTTEQLTEWTKTRVEELMKESLAAPMGYAIDFPPYRVSLPELGAVIRSALPPLRLKEYLSQMVLEEVLLQWGKENSVVVTEQILEAELAWRAKRVAENPAFGGMSYEKLLASQGSSIEAVRHGRELRAAGYLRLFSEIEFDDAWFAARSPEESNQFDLEHGETREISWLMLHAVEKKVDPIDLDFADAKAELESYLDEINNGDDFARLATELSEHEPSRPNGGRLGWVHRAEPGVVNPNILAAAFSLSPGQISQPIRFNEGMAIVMCHQLRPRPDDASFKSMVRRGKHNELRPLILARYKAEFAY